MTNEAKSIHDFDISILGEYFSRLERQGPGSEENTLKALGFIENLTEDSRIADIGCGTGAATMTLARHTAGQITGLDLFPVFIDIFNANFEKSGLADRVKGVVGSMEKMPFAKEELDLIWSEGAIYNIGFTRGLKEWRNFIKPGGYIAVSEVSWFTDDRPEEIDQYWQEAYPEIDTIAAKTALMQAAGYVPVATFILPENCWTENFYDPQIKVQEDLRQKYPGNEAVEQFLRAERHEADLYFKYKQYYGYAFYIGRKI